ncbi:hypothetical protein MAQ5080_03395 [Marinomonas aquimarina]|uniref:Uncharacterized protein n=2 Tax=Marinomonas aquimarina TaxID=295068 RepID=A0A1A8TT55_9GAMM|nr:hypothetical protein [Marinomonas aquimarina]SBS36227.1 hypothetical protein MAQ5080_03395 [Marinomonas aquimarina]
MSDELEDLESEYDEHEYEDESDDDSYDDAYDDSYDSYDDSDHDSEDSHHDMDDENEGGYSITFDELGNFVALYEYEDDGSLENETEDDSTYVFIDGLLYETEVEDYGVEISIYSDADNDGVYEKISSEYSLNEGATGSDFVLTGSLGVLGSDNDDWILMSDFVESEGGSGADSFIMRDLTESTVKDFNVEEGDKIVFDTGFGLSDVDELAQYVSELAYDSVTQTLTVDFNGLASLEIVGIADFQISWDIVDVLS